MRKRGMVWVLTRSLLVLGALLAGAVSAIAVHFARRVLTPVHSASTEVVVHEVVPSSVAPSGLRVWISGQDTGLDGKYSFIWAAGRGHARLGEVVDRRFVADREWVARDVFAIDRGELRAGIAGRITGWWFATPEETGFAAEEVRIPVDGGHATAWMFRPPVRANAAESPQPGDAGHWAVHVHGRGALPEETLRGVAPLTRAGYCSLVVSYRNDPGAPSGVNGRYGLGLAESRDVDAAVAWAVAHGAKRVTLVGWSMGGTASLLASISGAHRQFIDRLVLDSPAVDWPGVLEQQARLTHLPQRIAAFGMQLLRLGWVKGAVQGERGTAIEQLVPERFASDLRVPVLILASPEDTFVPWNGAQQLAALRPDLVTLQVLSGEHVKLWNVDPARWERAVEQFVATPCDPPVNTGQ